MSICPYADRRFKIMHISIFLAMISMQMNSIFLNLYIVLKMYFTITSLNCLAERALFKTQKFQEQKYRTIYKSRKLVSTIDIDI